jgi:hypothetical protein
LKREASSVSKLLLHFVRTINWKGLKFLEACVDFILRSCCRNPGNEPFILQVLVSLFAPFFCISLQFEFGAMDKESESENENQVGVESTVEDIPHDKARSKKRKEFQGKTKASSGTKRVKGIDDQAEESGDDDEEGEGGGESSDDGSVDEENYVVDDFLVRDDDNSDDDGSSDDEGDDDDDEDGEDDEANKKKSLQRLKKRKGLDLDDDDEQLIRENEQLRLEQMTKKDTAAADSDDNSDIAPEVVRNAVDADDDEEEEGGDGAAAAAAAAAGAGAAAGAARGNNYYADEDDEGSDMGGFIVDDDEEGGDGDGDEDGGGGGGRGAGRGSGGGAASAHQVTHRRTGQRREGPTYDQIQEAMDIFGEGFDDFDDEDEEADGEGGDDLDENADGERQGGAAAAAVDENGLTKKEQQRIQKVRSRYERSQLVATFCTERDDVLRRVDRPERLQEVLVGRDAPSHEERLLEAKWQAVKVAAKIFADNPRPAGSLTERELRAQLEGPIAQVLYFLQIEQLDVPFIWTYRRDYLHSLMTKAHLWYIFRLEEDWDANIATKMRLSEEVAAMADAAQAAGQNTSQSDVGSSFQSCLLLCMFLMQTIVFII